MTARRERYLKDLVEEHGSVQVCAFCNFSLALQKNLKDDNKVMTMRLNEVDPETRWMTIDKVPMKFGIGEFSAAGGCVATSRWTEPPPGNLWLSGFIQRTA